LNPFPDFFSYNFKAQSGSRTKNRMLFRKRKCDALQYVSEDSDDSQARELRQKPRVRPEPVPDHSFSCTRAEAGKESAQLQPSTFKRDKALWWVDALPKTSSDLLYPLTVGTPSQEDLAKIEAIMPIDEIHPDITFRTIKSFARMDRVLVITNTNDELQCFAIADHLDYDWSMYAMWVHPSVRGKGLGTAMCSIFESMAIARREPLLKINSRFSETESFWERQGLVHAHTLASTLLYPHADKYANSNCMFKLLVTKKEHEEELPPHLEAVVRQPMSNQVVFDMNSNFDIENFDELMESVGVHFDRMGIVLAIVTST
jgi:GNAT superfamily N-acetyltransferase